MNRWPWGAGEEESGVVVTHLLYADAEDIKTGHVFTSRNNKHVPVINLLTCAVQQRDTGSLYQSWSWTLRIIQGQIWPVNSYFILRANAFQCSLFHSLNFLLRSTVNTSFGCFLSFSTLRANRQRCLWEFIPCLWLLVAPLTLLWRLELYAKVISSGTTARFSAFSAGKWCFLERWLEVCRTPVKALSCRNSCSCVPPEALFSHFYHFKRLTQIESS